MALHIDKQGRQNLVMKLHEEKDADIILRLSGENKQGYIKRLIREDLDADQIKKMRCCKCGAISKIYLKIKRYESVESLVLPLCQTCANVWLRGFNEWPEE